MCGIVGLLLKKAELRGQLGELMTPMLIGMTSRGPDSAGVAIFGEPVDDNTHKLSLFWGEGEADWKRLSQELSAVFEGKHRFVPTGQHAVLTTPANPEAVKSWLAEAAPEIYVLSMGPLAGLNNRGWIDHKWDFVLSRIYAPVMWTINNVPIIGPGLDSYVRLWLPSEPPSSEPPLTPEMRRKKRPRPVQ